MLRTPVCYGHGGHGVHTCCSLGSSLIHTLPPTQPSCVCTISRTATSGVGGVRERRPACRRWSVCLLRGVCCGPASPLGGHAQVNTAPLQKPYERTVGLPSARLSCRGCLLPRWCPTAEDCTVPGSRQWQRKDKAPARLLSPESPACCAVERACRPTCACGHP